MQRRLRISLGVLLLLTILQLTTQAHTAQACSCGRALTRDGQPPTARDTAEHYSAVFQGRVLGIGDEPPGPLGFGRGTRVLFEVTKAWKGVEKSQVIVHTSQQVCCVCAYPFGLWQSYLVFASADPIDGELVTTLCDATTSLGGASQMIADLGPGRAPTQIVQLENPNSFMANLPMLMAAGVIITLSVALIVKQRRRAYWHKKDPEH